MKTAVIIVGVENGVQVLVKYEEARREERKREGWKDAHITYWKGGSYVIKFTYHDCSKYTVVYIIPFIVRRKKII